MIMGHHRSDHRSSLKSLIIFLDPLTRRLIVQTRIRRCHCRWPFSTSLLAKDPSAKTRRAETMNQLLSELSAFLLALIPDYKKEQTYSI